MENVDVGAGACPCCGAARGRDDAEWPWMCECRQCPVVALGRTCRNPAPCWDNCPYRAA